MNKTLLVADDSKTIRTAVAYVFRQTEFSVVQAEAAEAALQKASHDKPDVILADAAMSGTDGFALLSALRQDANTAAIPIILMGHENTLTPGQATAAGANGQLAKPFGSKELIDLVRDTVANAAEMSPEMAAAETMEPSPVSPEAAAPPPLSAPTLEPPPPAAAAPQANVPMWSLADSPVAHEEAIEEISIDDDVGVDVDLDMDTPLDVSPTLEPPAPPASANSAPSPAATIETQPTSAMVSTLAEPVAEAASLALPEVDKGALTAAAREIIEQIAWEVVPELAETIIREEISRLTREAGV